MFCENCGAQNVDGAKFCASCGAPLAVSQPAQPQIEQAQYQPQIEQTQYQPPQPQYNYNYNYNYQQPQVQPARPVQQGRSVGAVIVYMISGALAVLSIIMVFLPHVTVLFRNFNPFQLIGTEQVFGRSSDAAIGGVIIIALLVLPMILQLVWAILSFARVRAAGVLGLIASIFAINHTVIWLVILSELTERTSGAASMTAVPGIMLFLGIAGLVMSIIQMTKKNRVR